MRRHWTELADAADSLGVLLGPIEKATQSILSRAGFRREVRRFAQDLMRKVRAPEGAAFRRMVRGLDKRWRALTARQRELAIRRAVSKLFSLPGVVIPAVSEVVERRSAAMMAATKAASSAQHGLEIATSLDVVDDRVIRHARRSQVFYLRNEYGVREAALSRRARTVVADGLEQGFDNSEISALLVDELAATSAARSQAYYQTVANIWGARARTYGLLRSFQDGGIGAFKFTSVLDQKTTDICRFMDGKVFQTEAALERYTKSAELDDPEGVEDLMPFVNKGRDDDGNSILYFNRGEERVLVAQVDRSAVGEADAIGDYSRAMSASQLESAGVMAPPLHGRCRSTLEALV